MVAPCIGGLHVTSYCRSRSLVDPCIGRLHVSSRHGLMGEKRGNGAINHPSFRWRIRRLTIMGFGKGNGKGGGMKDGRCCPDEGRPYGVPYGGYAGPG